MRCFQFFSIQNSIEFGEGQMPVKYPIKSLSTKDKSLFLEEQGRIETFGISSNFLTKLEGGGDFKFFKKPQPSPKSPRHQHMEGLFPPPMLTSIRIKTKT
jgi:hypothetical protein